MGRLWTKSFTEGKDKEARESVIVDTETELYDALWGRMENKGKCVSIIILNSRLSTNRKPT